MSETDTPASTGLLTQTPPTGEGLHWVWQPSGTWAGTGIVRAVEVELHDGVLCAWVPFMDSVDPVVPRDDSDSWIAALWSGPIQRPTAPSVAS